MNKRFSYLTFFVTIITMAIVAIQIYWNWKSYEDTKKRLIYDIQVTTDNAIDKYFIEVSRENLRNLFPSEYARAIPVHYDTFDTINSNENALASSRVEAVIPEKIKSKRNKASGVIINKIVQQKEYSTDSTKILTVTIDTVLEPKKIKKNNHATIDRLEIKNENMQQAIVIEAKSGQSIKLFGDAVNFKKLIPSINKALSKKGLSNRYQLVDIEDKNISYAYDNDSKKDITKTFAPLKSWDVVKTKSDYLNFSQELKLYFKDLHFIAFKKTFNSILLSLVLSIGMIWCMFFLIQTIKKQKQIAEMKNDFISNISHELKTPIAIVTSAIEGIQNFNSANDKEKTEKYLQISGFELQKLNTIVEKILENSSLENKEVVLKKMDINLSEIIKNNIENHQLKTDKKLVFKPSTAHVICHVDAFHIENCVSNLIENAIKYGGDSIEIVLNQTSKTTFIEVNDNGNGIPKQFQNKVFDKFYRIPTQNIHNVKGFGIGLYYVKQLIEKHKGTIGITSNSVTTSFKITLPNE